MHSQQFSINVDENFKLFQEAVEQEIAEAIEKDYYAGFCLLYQDNAPVPKAGFFNTVMEESAYVIKDEAKVVDSYLQVYSYANWVVILPRTAAVDVVDSAHAIREAVEKHNFDSASGTAKITVCVAVATYPHEAKTANDIIALLEERVNKAIAAGGNTVVYS